jgi:hypothetical protein
LVLPHGKPLVGYEVDVSREVWSVVILHREPADECNACSFSLSGLVDFGGYAVEDFGRVVLAGT